jgi:acyl-coenzyme A thioesterase PaaI-like protein
LNSVDDSGTATPTPTPPPAARLSTAEIMRRLGHAVVAHEVSDDLFATMTSTFEALLAQVEGSPARQVPPLDMSRDLFTVAPPQGRAGGSYFPDCIMTGSANPMGVAAETRRDGDDAVVRATLGPAFEGAPGRAHGGVVAALFDEVMGFVLSIACTPAFTGRLSVTYRAPVPLGVPLEFRARLARRDGRKLLIEGDARHDDVVLAQADALFIAVEPARFAAGHS